jgi:hypothetical protein
MGRTGQRACSNQAFAALKSLLRLFEQHGIQLAVPGCMPKPPPRSKRNEVVLVLSSNPETLDGLHEYFSQTGIASSGRRAIYPQVELSCAVRALVVFPDDFPAHQASAYLSMVRTRRPDLTIVIVTREPPIYRVMTATDGHPLKAIVLPRPAFGWTILDAIRSTQQA